MGALTYTVFYNEAAGRKTECVNTLPDLANAIRNTKARSKDALPWIKLARFGQLRTKRNSLRNNDNVIEITGVEADYDREIITFDEAVNAVTRAGVLSIVYTSPSHTEETPRWRVLCPASRSLPPNQRERLMGRLNGIFRGELSVESFVLSQSYYYGRIGDNPSHQVEIVDGDPIDTLDELDAIFTPKRGTLPVAGSSSVPRTGPIDEPALLAEIASGVGYHVPTLALIGKWARDGVPFMDARQRLIDAMEAVFPPDRDTRWHDRRNDVDRCLEDIYGKVAGQRDQRADPPGLSATAVRSRDAAGKPGSAPAEPAPYIPLSIVNPVALEGEPISPRRWIVEDWLPIGSVTLFYGDGGIGKTLLAQQLMTSVTTGTHWLGLPVPKHPVFAIFCEDDEHEVHRRQDRINAACGLSYADLERMRYACAVGADNVLVRFERDGSWQVTPRFIELTKAAKAHGAKLLVIDTAADTFGGNENDRAQVRAYLGAVLTRLARDADCAVLVNAHPSRSGLSATGDLDGGSTAWSNTARSRWALVRPETEDGAAPDENARILSRRKANYAARGEEIELRWTAGVLIPARQTAPSFIETANRVLGTEVAFLDLLDRCAAQNVFVSNSVHAGNYAPKVFAKRPERDGRTRRDFEAAMNNLFAQKRVTNAPYGRASDLRFRIERAGIEGTSTDTQSTDGMTDDAE